MSSCLIKFNLLPKNEIFLLSVDGKNRYQLSDLPFRKTANEVSVIFNAEKIDGDKVYVKSKTTVLWFSNNLTYEQMLRIAQNKLNLNWCEEGF